MEVLWQDLRGIHDLKIVSPQKLDILPILRHRYETAATFEPEAGPERVDPGVVLPGCQSVLVAFYQLPRPQWQEMPEGAGRLASVSWGEDYHTILRDSLRMLQERLEAQDPTGEFFLQVDTGPLYERGFAQKTGAGHLGKSGNFIHHRLGSYVALGILCTTLELPLDEEEGHYSCGDCSRCIQACPGGCLHEDGTMIPTSCRSFLSQKKGMLTAKEQEILGDALYGCDICQWVCPKNQGVEEKNAEEDLLHWVRSQDLEGLSNKKFREIYGHRSGAWRGAALWRRNLGYMEEASGPGKINEKC
ncbi:MAG: DUF1730 domain-containing protein [Tissierellia bacterium]|nr:DUF1730 domain-containing protein [Tissierellia bacterium]